MMSINFTLFAILLVLMVSLLPNGSARYIPYKPRGLSGEPSANVAVIVVNSTSSAQRQQDTTTVERTAPRILRHLVRDKRELYVPFDFDVKHLPCDYDMKQSLALKSLVEVFPGHCIWAYNNRYVSEDAFRIFKTYQLESFMFGQYHERLRRFEMDPHTWDYETLLQEVPKDNKDKDEDIEE